MARIAIYSVTAPLGGHLRSALTIALELSSRGHDVRFITSEGPGAGLVRKSGIPHFILPSNPLKSDDFYWRDYLPLKKYIHDLRPHIIHTFLKGIPQLALIGRGTGSKLVATICGGKPHKFFPKMSPTTVFSEELRQWLLSRGVPDQYIYVIPGRMNLRIPDRDEDVDIFLEKHGLAADTSPLIFMICRTDKMKVLERFFLAAELFSRQNNLGAFIHIGAGNTYWGKQEESVRQMAVAVNERAGRKVLVSTDCGSNQPVKFLHLATVVAGMGRTAFEAMAMGKPTLILSNEGFGGLVCLSEIEQIAKFNFTARHLSQRDVSPEYSAQRFVEAVQKLLQDQFLYDEVAAFGRKYYTDELDVSKAVDRYEEIYFAQNIRYDLPGMIDMCYAVGREFARIPWHCIQSLNRR